MHFITIQTKHFREFFCFLRVCEPVQLSVLQFNKRYFCESSASYILASPFLKTGLIRFGLIVSNKHTELKLQKYTKFRQSCKITPSIKNFKDILDPLEFVAHYVHDSKHNIKIFSPDGNSRWLTCIKLREILLFINVLLAFTFRAFL